MTVSDAGAPEAGPTGAGPVPVPEVVFQGETVPVPELLRYSLVLDVHFEAAPVPQGPEFLFTGSVLRSTDGRLYFIPSGKFQELSLAHADPRTDA